MEHVNGSEKVEEKQQRGKDLKQTMIEIRWNRKNGIAVDVISLKEK